MATLPAISIDSFGNRSVPGLPPLVANPGTDANRQQLVRWVELSRRDPPGQWTDDRWQQARSFTNAVYVAVRTVMTGLSGATAVVSQKRPGAVRKSQQASAAGAGESDWVPVGESHEIARLFADPNDRDTFADFLAEYSLCRAVFGLGAVLWVPNRAGKPTELWNLRANYLTAAGGLTTEYPSGYWRYYMPQPMLWSTSAGSLTVPRERVVIHRHPHPLFPWDGYSPLTAGGKLVDFLNGVIDSRQMAMDRGLSLDAVIKVAGGSVDQIAQMKAQFEQRFTGSNRGSRFAVVDGERVDIATLGNTPDKMSYKDSYDQGTSAVLALFGVPQSVAGLNESSSYSAFYAAARQFRETTLNAEAKAIGDVLTKHLIRPHWGDGFKVEIKLPPLMDPDLRERQNGTLMSGNGITINELRASYDLPPMEGGDVTPKEFEAELQKKAQPDPMAGMTGGDPADDPIAALLGGDPNAEPGAPGEVEPPDVGGASVGSLPGAVSKAVDVDALTRAALQFAKAVGRKNPCWPGYEMVGTKVKGGRRVPNCVPVKRKKAFGCGGCSGDCDDCTPLRVVKAEYRGRTVTLNKPFRTKGGPKKFAVYVKNDAGNVVIVRFGDPDMEIKRDDPEARKNFRARHKCAEAKDRTKAAYWSCRMWSDTPVSEATS